MGTVATVVGVGVVVAGATVPQLNELITVPLGVTHWEFELHVRVMNVVPTPDDTCVLLESRRAAVCEVTGEAHVTSAVIVEPDVFVSTVMKPAV